MENISKDSASEIYIEKRFAGKRVWCMTARLIGSIFGKRDLLPIFHVLKYDAKCVTCLHKFDCRETTLSNAANHF